MPEGVEFSVSGGGCETLSVKLVTAGKYRLPGIIAGFTVKDCNDDSDGKNLTRFDDPGFS